MKKLLGISAIVVGALALTLGIFLLFRLAQFRAAVSQIQNDGFPVSMADPTAASDQ